MSGTLRDRAAAVPPQVVGAPAPKAAAPSSGLRRLQIYEEVD
jgi:hypothetical protein